MLSLRNGITDPRVEISIADLRFLTSDDPDRIRVAYEAARSPLLSQATNRSVRTMCRYTATSASSSKTSRSPWRFFQ
jgi:hypothetical protein